MQISATTATWKLALWSRLCVWAVAAVTQVLNVSYDNSNTVGLALKLSPADSSRADTLVHWLLNGLSNWDGAHFMHIAEHGYEHEKQHAFFPLLPMLMRGCAVLVQGVANILSITLSNRSALLLAGAGITLLSFIWATVMLERLTYTLRGDKQFARLTAVVFICSPATIFLSAIYSEALFAAMAFTGCWLYAHRRFWSAAVFFALATCTRGNGIIFCGFFIVDFLQAVRSRSPCGFLVGKVVATGMQITLVLAPYVLYQVSSAQLYCSGAVTDAAYCTAFFPNIYGHIQATYWGVGFLKIYRVEQIPNFLLAGPVLFLSIKTVFVYVSANTTLFFTGGLIGENRNYSKDKFLERPVALTYFYHWAAALLICLTVLHIQVSTRFLTSVPAFHWAVAESIRHAGSGPAVAWKVWLAGYTVVGSVLFSAFYPWT